MAKKLASVKLRNLKLNRQGFFRRYFGIVIPLNSDKYFQSKRVKAAVNLEKFDQALIHRDNGNEADNYLNEVASKLKELGLLPNPDLSQANNITYKPNTRYMKATDKRVERGTGGTGDKFH